MQTIIIHMKTIRNLLILALIVSFVCLFSCKNGIIGKSSTKVDTVLNAKIQDTFFDTKFGASREEVIKNFAKHGFILNGVLTNITIALWMTYKVLTLTR